jgi:hypothetical protein
MFVACDNDDGEKLDLHVFADTPEAAIEDWRVYFELDDDELPERIFEVPTAGTGAQSWFGAVKQIWGSK